MFIELVDALSETGLTRMSRAKALGLEESGRRSAAALVRLVSRPEEFINPLLRMQLVSAGITGVRFLQTDFFHALRNPPQRSLE